RPLIDQPPRAGRQNPRSPPTGAAQARHLLRSWPRGTPRIRTPARDRARTGCVQRSYRPLPDGFFRGERFPGARFFVTAGDAGTGWSAALSPPDHLNIRVDTDGSVIRAEYGIPSHGTASAVT